MLGEVRTGRRKTGGPGDGQGAPGGLGARGRAPGRGAGLSEAAPSHRGREEARPGRGRRGRAGSGRRDAAELPLAMGGGYRARAPPAGGLRRAGLRLLLAHVVLLCAPGSAATDGSGTWGGGRHREGGRAGTGAGGGGSGNIPHRGGIRHRAGGRTTATGGGGGVGSGTGGGGPGERGGARRREIRYRGLQRDAVPEGPSPGCRTPGGAGDAGRWPGEVGAIAPSPPCPALRDGSGLRRVPGAGLEPIAPGWSSPRRCRDPAVGSGREAPERRAGAGGGRPEPWHRRPGPPRAAPGVRAPAGPGAAWVWASRLTGERNRP